jgi:hypothetical protein
MKQTDRMLEVADLKAVGHIEDEMVLFIANQDPNIPSSLCVRVNFSTLRYDPVQPMSAYLESASYQHIHDGDRRIAYRQWILEEMDPEETRSMLQDFTHKRLLSLEQEGIRGWEPSWEHPYGI